MSTSEQEPFDDRAEGEALMRAMNGLFDSAQHSERGASAEQVLTLAMGKMQALGLMAIYHEVRHGNEQQAAALRAIADELRGRS
jgi:hypothetical protein